MRSALCALAVLFLLSACEKHTATVEEEPFYQEQWALHYDSAFYDAYAIHPDAHINAEEALKRYSGRGIKIAVIDIGVDKEHPEFKESIVASINSRDGSSDVACEGSSACYHGSAVTGVIAANVNGVGLRGIAPDAQIVFIKLDLKGYVSDSEILNALEYAQKENVDIINCSWGTGDVSPVVAEKIGELATHGRDGKGTVIVFASGNEGKELHNDESMLESVIGVGASDEENLRAIYSNFGEGLDVVAPGGYALGITTTYESSDDIHHSDFMRAEDYEKFQGTSASAPIVSGSVALLLEADPELTRLEVQQLLQRSAERIGTVAYVEDRNDYYGYGKINVDGALSLVMHDFPLLSTSNQ